MYGHILHRTCKYTSIHHYVTLLVLAQCKTEIVMHIAVLGDIFFINNWNKTYYILYIQSIISSVG